MKAIFVRYLNEFVGLTIMALMTLALIAGQADAQVQQAVADHADQAHRVIEMRLSIAD